MDEAIINLDYKTQNNTPVLTASIKWEVLKQALYDSDLCSGEQTEDNTGEDDIGSYWLNDCTIDEIIEVFKQKFEPK